MSKSLPAPSFWPARKRCGSASSRGDAYGAAGGRRRCSNPNRARDPEPRAKISEQPAASQGTSWARAEKARATPNTAKTKSPALPSPIEAIVTRVVRSDPDLGRDSIATMKASAIGSTIFWTRFRGGNPGSPALGTVNEANRVNLPIQWTSLGFPPRARI